MYYFKKWLYWNFLYIFNYIRFSNEFHFDQIDIDSLTNKFKHPSSLTIVNEWKYLDFEYDTYQQRQAAIANHQFIPENNLPLGIDIDENRVFITTPRWKVGVPASLSTISYPVTEISPALRPYPNWDAHSDSYNSNCSKLISVYRTNIDTCHRLWLIDSGIVNATINLNQICPPKILAFDLHSDKLIISYELPMDQVKQDSLHSNIIVDIYKKQCDDAFVYVTDVWRFGIVVYSLAKNRSWRVTNFNFLPEPLATNFNMYGLYFQWTDGVFGMSLSLPQSYNKERYLFFHPMASYKEFKVPISLLQNESFWLGDNSKTFSKNKYFQEIGDRGHLGQSATSSVTLNGVMFFTLIQRDTIGCWDTSKPYIRANLYEIFNTHYNNIIQFPNDIKTDRKISKHQGIWIMSNRLPIYLYSHLNLNDINFRILYANINELINGTICDPLLETKFILTSKTVTEGKCY